MNIDDISRGFGGILNLNTTLLSVFLCIALVLVFVGHLSRTVVLNRRLNKMYGEMLLYKRALDDHCIVNMSDNKGRILSVNENFLRAAGLDAQEVIGATICSLFPATVTQQRHDDINAKLKNGLSWSGETEWKRRDGSVFWTHSTVVPFFDRKGRFTKSIALRTDITDNKIADAELQLRMMLDMLQDEVYMFSPNDFRFIYLNQRALSQLGWGPEDFNNKKICDAEGLFDVEQLHRKAKRLLRGVEGVVTFEADQAGRRVEINMQLIRPTGGSARFVAVVRDITERTAAVRAKSEFISTVSHELRTPLTSIKGALGLIGMMGDAVLPERTQSILNIAQRNTDRLILLINDLLDLEKLDAGKMDFQMGEMDIVELVRDAIEVNKSYAMQFGVQYVGVNLEKPCMVEGNSDRLMQVMANLMSNAAKFSKQGDTVEISVKDMGKTVRVCVKDDGSGIPHEAQASIFERFTQADSSDRRRVGGTGLGLSIAKAIVEKHGAKIKFESELGKGSEFYFDLQKTAARQVA